MGKNGKAIDRYHLIIGFGYDDSQLKGKRWFDRTYRGLACAR